MWKKEKKAFKEGKRIQCKNSISKWVDTTHPLFYEYRIHPEDIEPITEWHDKLVVHCKTKKQMEKVIELQPNRKSKLHYWDSYQKETWVRNDGKYGQIVYYKDEGYEVITAKEFLKRYKPKKKKKIGKEPLKEGEWAAFWDRYDSSYIVDVYLEYKNLDFCHNSPSFAYEFALPISVGHEAILKAMEETNNA